jgi:hypothetical protein
MFGVLRAGGCAKEMLDKSKKREIRIKTDMKSELVMHGVMHMAVLRCG